MYTNQIVYEIKIKQFRNFCVNESRFVFWIFFFFALNKVDFFGIVFFGMKRKFWWNEWVRILKKKKIFFAHQWFLDFVKKNNNNKYKKKCYWEKILCSDWFLNWMEQRKIADFLANQPNNIIYIKILRRLFKANDTNANKPILYIYSKVKVASILRNNARNSLFYPEFPFFGLSLSLSLFLSSHMWNFKRTHF